MSKGKKTGAGAVAKKSARNSGGGEPSSGHEVSASARQTASPVVALAKKPKLHVAALHQEIEQLAYQHFVERGCVHGGHVTDWYRAEAEVLAKYQ